MPNSSRSKRPTPRPQERRSPREGAEAEEEEEVEIDESLDDAAFIEEQEEEDADVTDIIGGDIETRRKADQGSGIESISSHRRTTDAVSRLPI